MSTSTLQRLPLRKALPGSPVILQRLQESRKTHGNRFSYFADLLKKTSFLFPM